MAIGSVANYNRAARRKRSSCLPARQAAEQLRHGAVCRSEVASPVDFLTVLTFSLPVQAWKEISARAWFRARLCGAAVHLLLPRAPAPPHSWGSAPGTPARPGALATACAASPPAAVSLFRPHSLAAWPKQKVEDGPHVGRRRTSSGRRCAATLADCVAC